MQLYDLNLTYLILNLNIWLEAREISLKSLNWQQYLVLIFLSSILGYRSRTLQSISTPNGKGRNCIPVVETQPCDPGPCYSWNLTKSGTCYLDHSERICGQGTKHNKLSCVDVNGVGIPCLCYVPKKFFLLISSQGMK